MKHTTLTIRCSVLLGLLVTLACGTALAHENMFNPIDMNEADGDVLVYMKANITAPTDNQVFHTGGTASMNVTYSADHRVVLTGDGTQPTSSWPSGGDITRGGDALPLDIVSATLAVPALSTVGQVMDDSTSAVLNTSTGAGSLGAGTQTSGPSSLGYTDHNFGHTHFYSVVNP